MYCVSHLPVSASSVALPLRRSFNNSVKLQLHVLQKTQFIKASSYTSVLVNKPRNSIGYCHSATSVKTHTIPYTCYNYNNSYKHINANDVCYQNVYKKSSNRNFSLSTEGNLIYMRNGIRPQSQLLRIQNFSSAQHRNYTGFTGLWQNAFTVNAAANIEDLSSNIPPFISPTLAAEIPALTASEIPAPTAAATATPTAAATEISPTATASAVDTVGPTDGIEYIPLPPSPPDLSFVDPATLNAAGEVTFSSLGLACWTPVGFIQSFLEFLHVSGGLPWWGTIAVATVMMRTLVFPLMVLSQRNSARLNNVMPQMQVLQMKVSDARNAGDHMQVARYSNELVVFMKDKDVNLFKTMLVPLAQAPIFISMFIGLRKCANLPVPSMAVGGMYWFMDLTATDPYYLLPLLTSATMLLTIEMGVDTGRMAGVTENGRYLMVVLRCMPIVFFPFMCNFPAAVLCYWLTTNVVSLVQASILKIPAVRSALKIPVMVKHDPNSLPITKKDKSKSIFAAAKDSFRNMQVTREIQDRQRYDEVRFSKAGMGPVVKTYKFDPTKQPGRKPAPTLDIKARLKL